MKAHKHRHRRGMSLAETMVTMALLSVVSLVTLQLYLSAQTEFNHSSGIMTLNQRARVIVDKIEQITKTAVPLLNNNAEAFVHPDDSTDIGHPLYEMDFISTICFISKNTTPWQITDNTSAGFVADATDPRFIYENDLGLTAFVARQPSLYRYRIAWNPSADTRVTNKGRSIAPRSVYFERLMFGEGNAPSNQGSSAKQLGQGPDSATYLSKPTGTQVPWIPDTGTPQSQLKARVLGRNVHYLAFTRVTGNVVLLRMKMYNRDPVTNIPVEGMTMSRAGYGGNRDPRDPNKNRLFLIDISTNIQLPNSY